MWYIFLIFLEKQMNIYIYVLAFSSAELLEKAMERDIRFLHIHIYIFIYIYVYINHIYTYT